LGVLRQGEAGQWQGTRRAPRSTGCSTRLAVDSDIVLVGFVMDPVAADASGPRRGARYHRMRFAHAPEIAMIRSRVYQTGVKP
jgi:hypothetical protein